MTATIFKSIISFFCSRSSDGYFYESYTDAHFLLGEIYEKSKAGPEGYNMALESFRKVTELRPDYADAYFKEAMLYLYHNEHLKAIPPLQKAIHADPNYIEAYLELARVYTHLGGPVYYVNADEVLKKLLEIDPDYAPAHLARGINSYKFSRYEVALEHLKKANAINPRMEEVHFYLGSIYKSSLYRDYTTAAKEFLRCLIINPDNKGCQSGYHSVKGRAERDAELEELISSATIKDEAAEAYYRYGQKLMFNDRKYEEAIEVFEKALLIDPNHKQALRELACAYSYTNNPRKAIETYERLIRILDRSDPMLISMLSALAETYLRQDAGKVIGIAHRIIEIAPDDFRGYLYLGDGFYYTGRFQEALGPYKKAVELKPVNTNTRFKLGMAYISF